MKESQMPIVLCGGKNPDSKGYIPYDFIYMTFWEREKYRNRKKVVVRG